MNNVNPTLPIFPLPVFLLPNGITRLRIFEPRYLKLVKIASTEQGFIILLQSEKPETTDITWGSWVEIINFDSGEDGVLEIDVKCKSLVKILSINNSVDKLQFGCVTEILHWSQKTKTTKFNALSASLEAVFDSDEILKALYHDKPTDNKNWVVARWLELLPVNLAVKSTFILDHTYQEAEKFVQSIILKN